MIVVAVAAVTMTVAAAVTIVLLRFSVGGAMKHLVEKENNNNNNNNHRRNHSIHTLSHQVLVKIQTHCLLWDVRYCMESTDGEDNATLVTLSMME
mmetsp:Transcript_20867/g.23973  ORF Transcript_20867/g.23973 Transcript_20867/m.23973 type:complete len:95 (+) Transcript_20867:736-1020(+)